MNEESRNWFRLSKLIIDVGADVLQHLAVENIQTSFLNESVYCWLATMDKVKEKNYAKILWNSFRQDFTDMDETCEIHLRPLHNIWKLRENQKLTFMEQVHTLKKWANDIETCLMPFLKKQLIDKAKTLPENQKLKQENYIQTPLYTKLSLWLEQVHDSIKNLNAISDTLQYLNTSFLEQCQQSRKHLLKEIKNHYDDFLSSSIDNVLQWDVTSKEEMKNHLTNLECDRKEMLESWKIVSHTCVKSLRQKIKDLLVSLERRAPHITDTPQLKKLCSYLKTAADEIDGTELQKSCDTWHKQLHDLIDKWMVTTNSVQPSHICTSYDFFCEINRFPSISSKQVNDFFLSNIENKELQQLKESKQLSEEQYLKLCNCTFHDLQQFGTTLLVIVLRTYLLYPPMHGWSEEPPEVDQSLSAEIVRLKSLRNIIIEYSAKTTIDKLEFDRLWLSVQQVLCRLAAESGYEYETEVSEKVDLFKTCSFSPERESELHRILDWCRNDILSEFKGLAQTHQCLHILDSVQKAERERSRREDAERLRQQQEEERLRQLREEEWRRIELEERRLKQLREEERRRQDQEEKRLRQLREEERLMQQQGEERLRHLHKEEMHLQLHEERLRHLRKEERLRQQQEEERLRQLREEQRLRQQEEEERHRQLREEDSIWQQEEEETLRQLREEERLRQWDEVIYTRQPEDERVWL